MRPDENATEPDVDTAAPAAAKLVPELALVILWSAEDPDRVGEIAYPLGDRWWYVGRGDKKVEDFAPFQRQLAGMMYDPTRRVPVLRGKRMSTRQLAFRLQGGVIEMKQEGQCLTLVNGEVARSARLKPDDTVLVRGMLLLGCVRRRRLIPALASGHSHSFGEPDANGIIGEAEATWVLRADLEAAAQSPYHVLVCGQSGSGKEMASAAIHKLSARRLGPYVSSNAGVFSSNLIESKLFGNIKNYPNPGMAADKGLFGATDGGTLFLDEIGDCPLEVQKTLLRVMESGEYTSLGEQIPRRTTARVVAATNQDLETLRPELYYRLKKRVRVPPLSERREDIPFLVRHLVIERSRAEGGGRVKRFLYTSDAGHLEVNVSARVIDFLVRQPLPGNVRELESFLDVFLEQSTGDQIRLPEADGPESLAAESVAPASAARADGKPSEEQVRAALKKAKGIVRGAAEVLGMKSTSLYRLIDAYGIKRGSVGAE